MSKPTTEKGAPRSPDCEEFFSGVRGMPVYDDTRGTPERTKGSRKSRASNEDGWTAFDVKLAKDRGRTIAQMDADRARSREWIDAFRERVLADLVRRGVDVQAPLPGCHEKEIPF